MFGQLDQIILEVKVKLTTHFNTFNTFNTINTINIVLITSTPAVEVRVIHDEGRGLEGERSADPVRAAPDRPRAAPD